MKNVSLLGTIELTTMPWNVFVGLNLIPASHRPIENAVKLFFGRENHGNGKIFPHYERASLLYLPASK
jgi:hypothetical protein